MVDNKKQLGLTFIGSLGLQFRGGRATLIQPAIRARAVPEIVREYQLVPSSKSLDLSFVSLAI